MRLLITRESLRRFLWWTQWILIVSAVLALSYCAVVLVDTWIFQKRAGAEFEEQLDVERAAREDASRSAKPDAPVAPPAIAPDGLIGRIEIERIGLSAVIFEGTGKATLRRAVGHISSTALPGHPGNTGLSAHRDSFFRPLRNIRQSDIITITTLRGAYRYRVVSTRVVAPTEVSVLDPSKTEVLTLVTCHPFYFVGSAPNRFIVRAERISNQS
jgi:sortase A